MEKIIKILKNINNEKYTKRSLENYKLSFEEGYINNLYLENEIYESIINELEDMNEINIKNLKKLEELAILAKITINGEEPRPKGRWFLELFFAKIYHKKAMVLKIVSETIL